MLNKICIISHEWKELLKAVSFFKEGVFIFLINSNNYSLSDLFNLVYKSVNTFNKQQQFSICFDFSSQAKPEVNVIKEAIGADDYLCNLAFHPAFYTNQNKPQLFFVSPEKHIAIADFFKEVSTTLTAQSFIEVETIAINRNKLFEIKKEDYHSGLADFYLNNFLNAGIYNQPIYIQSLPIPALKTVEEALVTTEEKFSLEHPILYNQAQKLATITQENERLKYKLKIYAENLDNHKQYLKLIQEQDEAETINQFYYNEYEVLPLWYKRFGHIIKALTGKRTFGSLFNDSVKNYKQ